MYIIKKITRARVKLLLNPSHFLHEVISLVESTIIQMIPFIDKIIFSLSLKRLNQFMIKEDSLDSILYTAYNYQGFWSYKNIRPWQIPSEIKKLLIIIENKIVPLSNILEIGTYNGGGLYLWARYLKAKTIITIDLIRGYPPEKIKLYKLFDVNKKIHCLKANSHDEKTTYKVSNILKSKKIDFLFIDGDHSYEGVKKDFEMYSKFVRVGGIIAFHDINHPSLGVATFWNEIKNKYPSKEIIASRKEIIKFATSEGDILNWGGIGVIYL